MPINIGKNLKIEPTNDTKVSKFVRDYGHVHDYINEHQRRGNIAYYAYYSPRETYGPGGSNYGAIIYCTKEYTSTSGESLGEDTFYVKYIIEDEETMTTGVCVCRSVEEVEACDTTTVEITSFLDTGFKNGTWYYYYRCPGLDIYEDGSVGDGSPGFYCYYSRSTEWQDPEYDQYVYIPTSPDGLNGLWSFWLLVFDNWQMTHHPHPTYDDLNAGATWRGSYEGMDKISDGVYETFGAWTETLTRYPQEDLYVKGYNEQPRDLILYDLLMALIPSYVISYDNLPEGATFTWSCNGEILPQSVEVQGGSTIEYELVYSDGSKCVNSFVVGIDYTLDLSALQPNMFTVTITSDKTLDHIALFRHYQTPQQTYQNIFNLDNNSYTFYADKDEPIRATPIAEDYSYYEKSTNTTGHSYDYTVTENIVCNATFPYLAWRAYNIKLLDENGQAISNITQYRDNITVTGDADYVTYKKTLSTSYFAIWSYPNTTFSYTIDISGYAPISDTTSTSVNTQVSKTLLPFVTYTLTPDPAEATVTLTAPGYTTVSGVGTQSITIAKGTEVTYVIALEDYTTQTNTFVVNSTMSETKQLEPAINYDVDDTEYTITQNGTEITLERYIGSSNDVNVPGSRS